MSYEIVAPKDTHLAEVYQDMEIKFSFAKKLSDTKFQRLHTYALCRDFLGDVLHAEESGKSVSIYSFAFNPQELKIDRDKTRLIIKFPTKEFLELFLEQFQGLFQQVEKDNSFEPTKAFKASVDEILVEGDHHWQLSSPLISLYTFMLKAAAYEMSGDYKNWMEILSKQETNEGQYITLAKNGDLPKFMDRLHLFTPEQGTTVHGWDGSSNIGKIHHASGFVSVFSGKVVEGPYKMNGNKYRELVMKG